MMDPDDDDVRQDQKVLTQPRWVSVLTLVWFGTYVALAYPARPSFVTPTVIGVVVGSFVVLLLAVHLWRRRRRRAILPSSSAYQRNVELIFMSLMVGMLTIFAGRAGSSWINAFVILLSTFTGLCAAARQIRIHRARLPA